MDSLRVARGRRDDFFRPLVQRNAQLRGSACPGWARN